MGRPDGKFHPHTKELIWARDGGCIRCGAYTAQIHHRIPRSAGGTRNPLVSSVSNGIVLCGSGTTGCHAWVESHRDASKEHGWIIPAVWGKDPALVACWYPLEGRSWLLQPGGSRVEYLDEPSF